MARQLETYFKVEAHGTVRFLLTERFTSTEIRRDVSTAYGLHSMSRPGIVKCCQQFEDGYTFLTVLEREVTVQS